MPLLPYAAERRQKLLQALDELEAEIGELDRRVAEEARQRPEAVRLMTHPGVGPVTALAMVLTLGPAERFESAKQVGSYFGLIPSEESSGGKQRLGKISKQGSSFLRFLLVEAGQTAVRYDPQLKRFYKRLATRKNRGVAKVAVARKLATRLYLMLREGWTYAQLKSGGHVGEPESSRGRARETDRLNGQPASLKSGEFEVRIMGASPEEMDGGTGESRCTI